MLEATVAGNCRRLLRRVVRERGQDVTKAPQKKQPQRVARGRAAWVVFLTPC